MKKIVFIAIISTFIFSFSSCKEDDTSSLAGTSWMSIQDEGYTRITLSFLTTSKGELFSTIEDVGGPHPITYTYTPPTIDINMGDGSVHGTVNGSTMTLYYDDEEDGIVYLTFIKQ